MNNTPTTNSPWMIASSIDIPDHQHGFDDYLQKIAGLPLREIEVELDNLERLDQNGSSTHPMKTAMINYPLGGCTGDFILDTVRWACEKNADIICTNLPLFWLRFNQADRLRNLLGDIKGTCADTPLRISLESSSLSLEEIATVCEMICDAEILQIKTSCGFSHQTSRDVISLIREKYSDLVLTVDGNLKGNSLDLDELFQLGVSYVCVEEPWLYSLK